MPDRYAAFISYSHRYAPWVRTLQANLERCLAAAGRPGKVFLDQTDLGSGHSWVAQLEMGLATSDHFVLVATPEALASPRVADEWRAFVTRNPHWNQGRFHVAFLVDAPVPPFLDTIERVDFRENREEAYRRSLRKLVGGLLGRAPRDLPEPPADVEFQPLGVPILDPILELEVRSEVERAPRAEIPGGEVARPGRPMGLREVLALPREDDPWITGRWVVLGDPGAGKTTLLRHLAAVLAREGGAPWVPLFESLPQLLRERGGLLERAVRRLERTSGSSAQGLGGALETRATPIRSSGWTARRNLFSPGTLASAPRKTRIPLWANSRARRRAVSTSRRTVFRATPKRSRTTSVPAWTMGRWSRNSVRLEVKRRGGTLRRA